MNSFGSRVTESSLILRARQGDTAAWEALTRLHQEPVFRLAYLLLGEPDDAEDIAQETFVRAYFALGRFDLDRPMRPWLLSIASNLVSNRRRSLARYLTAVQRFFWESPRHHTLDTPSEDAQELWAAVRRLKHAYQQVIYLRFFLEMSESETAATLGIATGTVKSRQHRALAELRELITLDFPSLKDVLGT